MEEKLRILVTGGTGFVGNSIIEELRNAEKYEIYDVVRKTAGISGRPLEAALNIIQGDVSEYKTLKQLEGLEKIEVLIHAAGLAHQFGKTSKEEFWRVNAQGTENICRLAGILKVRHFILISSVSVYGHHGDHEVDESFKCEPDGFYAESKFEAERRAIDLCRQFGIRLTVLRLATVIGEGDRGNVSRLITLINNNHFVWIGKGNNRKSLIYKTDVAKAVVKVIESRSEMPSEIFNLTQPAVSMREIVEGISGHLKKRPLPLKIPEQIVTKLLGINARTFSAERLNKAAKTLEKWLSNDMYSGKKLTEHYGFTPQTTISEGISKQVAFYLEQERSEAKLK